MTKQEFSKLTGLSFGDATKLIESNVSKKRLYISEWNLSKERTSWIPVFSLGKGINVRPPNYNDFKPRRDWMTTVFYGEYVKEMV